MAELGRENVWPFPLESHHNLAQELCHVFDANVVVIFGPGSGHAILGALLSNMRVVSVCCMKFSFN